MTENLPTFINLTEFATSNVSIEIYKNNIYVTWFSGALIISENYVQWVGIVYSLGEFQSSRLFSCIWKDERIDYLVLGA